MVKKMLVLVGLLVGCATVNPNPHAYQEMTSCPVMMDEQQKLSGTVRCRALCSSYARDMALYDDNCKCWCEPPGGKKQPEFKAPMDRLNPNNQT